MKPKISLQRTTAIVPPIRQRGIILFFALVALVAMSLAAVALIRSVDTGALIAGNLAFRKSALNSSDNGVEAAMAMLTSLQNNQAAGLSQITSLQHPFNLTCLATRAPGSLSQNDPGCSAIVRGYHSNIDPSLDLFADATWNSDILSVDATNATDAQFTKNSVRYLIQRVCRTANALPANAGCLYSGNGIQLDANELDAYNTFCSKNQCPPAGQSPVLRITARTTGPNNTVSFTQTFVY